MLYFIRKMLTQLSRNFLRTVQNMHVCETNNIYKTILEMRKHLTNSIDIKNCVYYEIFPYKVPYGSIRFQVPLMCNLLI